MLDCNDKNYTPTLLLGYKEVSKVTESDIERYLFCERRE